MDHFFQLLDCLANPSRFCLITPLLVLAIAGAFLLSTALGWSAMKIAEIFQRVLKWVFFGALGLMAFGALAIAGWRLIRDNPRWLGPMTENLASLAFILLGLGFVMLAVAAGFALGRWLSLRGIKSGPPGEPS